MIERKKIQIEYGSYILEPNVSSDNITIIYNDKESSISDVIKELIKDLEDLKNSIGDSEGEGSKPTIYTGDLNDLVTKGRYYASANCTNLPTSKADFFVDVNVADLFDSERKDRHKYQVAYKMTGDKQVYSRNQNAGAWTEWQRIDGIDKADKSHKHDEYASKKEVEDLKQSGDRINEKLVGALILKKVEASTDDPIYDNAKKVGTIKSAVGNAKEEHVLEGNTFSSENKESRNGSMKNIGKVTETIKENAKSVTIAKGYHDGTGKVTSDITNLKPSYIREGITIGGVKGTYRFMANKEDLKSIDDPHFALIEETEDRKKYMSDDITSEGLKAGDIVIMSGEKKDYNRGRINAVSIGFLKEQDDEFEIVDQIIGKGDFQLLYIGKDGTSYIELHSHPQDDLAEIQNISFYREI